MALNQVAHLFKVLFIIVVTVVVLQRASCAAESDALPPVRLRIEWGGGDKQSWTGRIEIQTNPSSKNIVPDNFISSRSEEDIDWCLLTEKADEAIGLHRDGSALVI